MYKETHVFKWTHDGEIGHYLDIKNPMMYRPAGNSDWKTSEEDLFEWHRRTGGAPWKLESIKPLVLENK